MLLIGVKYEQPRCQRNNSYINNDKVNDDIKINYLYVAKSDIVTGDMIIDLISIKLAIQFRK